MEMINRTESGDLMKSLVLAEKPSVAREIARVLNCTAKGKGYLEGSRYVVTWALGHLVALAEPRTMIRNTKSGAWKTCPWCRSI